LSPIARVCSLIDEGTLIHPIVPEIEVMRECFEAAVALIMPFGRNAQKKLEELPDDQKSRPSKG
jgi:hypothetical protein